MRSRFAVLLALAALAVAGLAVSTAAAPKADDSLARSVEVQLTIERRLMRADLEALATLNRRIETQASEVDGATAEVRRQMAEGEKAVLESLLTAEAALTEAEAGLETSRSRAREVRERLYARLLRVQYLAEEWRRARQTAEQIPDPVSGVWEVSINPGAQKGLFDLELDGTIVTGSYTLEGGFRGSLRGTLVGTRIRLERIDSELDLSSVYYARLNPRRDMAGTWESTQLAQGGPGSGTWSARFRGRGSDRQSSSGETAPGEP